jgi:hypothetical protein
MSEDPVVVSLERLDIPPGGEVSGWFSVPSREGERPEEVTLALRYRTHGKGDEDIENVQTVTYTDLVPGEANAFRFLVPMSPRSYEGVYIKIHWEVAVTAQWPKTGGWLAKSPQVEGVKEFSVGLIEIPPETVVE